MKQLAVAALLLLTSRSAASVLPFGFQGAAFSTNPTGASFSVPKFDPQLGIFHGASIFITYSAEAITELYRNQTTQPIHISSGTLDYYWTVFTAGGLYIHNRGRNEVLSQPHDFDLQPGQEFYGRLVALGVENYATTDRNSSSLDDWVGTTGFVPIGIVQTVDWWGKNMAGLTDMGNFADDEAFSAVTFTGAVYYWYTKGGDSNNDGKVDAADYVIARKSGLVDEIIAWHENFGDSGIPPETYPWAASLSSAVPEPTASTLAVILFGFVAVGRRKRLS